MGGLARAEGDQPLAFCPILGSLPAIGLPLLMLLSGGSNAYVVVALVASLMVLWRHRSNIERLLAGTEPKIGQKAKG